MEKEILNTFIDQGLSLRQISVETGKSLTTIRYWVKKYDLKSKHLPFFFIGKKGIW
jgi:transposase